MLATIKMIIFKIPVFNFTNGYHGVARTLISGALTITSVTELVWSLR